MIDFPQADMHHVVANGNYTRVSLPLRSALVRCTMQYWLEVLPPHFLSVHRGLIINLDHVGRIEKAAGRQRIIHFLRDRVNPITIHDRHWADLRQRLETRRAEVRRVRLSPGADRRVAVLAFDNLGGDPRHDGFCDGISEELLNALARIPTLRVPSRTSCLSLRGKNLLAGDIARELDVDYLVEGSVRRSGNHVRVAARLIEAGGEKQMWSVQFDQKLTDPLVVQTEIAGRIAHHLHINFPGAQAPAADVNTEARRFTLEGRHYWSLRTHEALERAAKKFAAAIACVPGYAPAHAGLADVYVVRAMYRLADGEPEAGDDLEGATRSARQALALDPTLGEAHATLGFAHFHAGRFTEALGQYPRALALNRHFATGYQFYAWTLCAAGYMDHAINEYAKSVTLDPLAFINLDRYAAMLALAGRLEEALEVSERAAALRPDVVVGNAAQRAVILIELGRGDEAVALARRVCQLTPHSPYRRNADSDAIYVLQQAGLPGEAAAHATDVLSRLAPSNYLRGFVLAALGQVEEAIVAVQSAPAIMLPFLFWSPIWRTARASPHFADLARRLGRVEEYSRVCEYPHKITADAPRAGQERETPIGLSLNPLRIEELHR